MLMCYIAALLRKQYDIDIQKLSKVEEYLASLKEDILNNTELGIEALDKWRADEWEWVGRIARREKVDDLTNPYASRNQARRFLHIWETLDCHSWTYIQA